MVNAKELYYYIQEKGITLMTGDIKINIQLQRKIEEMLENDTETKNYKELLSSNPTKKLWA